MLGLLIGALAVAVTASAQIGPAGHWEGTVMASNGPSRLSLDVGRDAEGTWVASLGLPERSVTGLRVADLRVQAPAVSFTGVDLPGKPHFRLVWKERSLAGRLLLQGKELPVSLTLNGSPKVELPESLAPLPKELEGDWEGSLNLSNNRVRPVTIHFRNSPDGTASATLDSITQGMTDALLHNIVSDGKTVAFSVRSYGGTFTGVLTGDASEIKGEWVQSRGQKPVPLIFKKK